MSLDTYYAYYTGAVALRTICRKAVLADIKKVKAPKGKKKAEAVILGRQYVVASLPIDAEEILNNLAEYQALNAVKNLPLKNPSGCSWEQLWEAYKERYKE